MTVRRALPVAAGLALAVLAGCVSALRPPEPLPAAETAAEPEDDGRADELWATRTVPSVVEAAEAYERRLGREVDPFGSVIGATRAWTWVARRAPTPEERREAAGRAVRAAQWCEEVAPGRAECAYWLGAALGVQAQQRRATALDALPRIVALFEDAGARIPDYESAGPFRALALLLTRAPGFPIGPGDPDRAVELARTAVRLEPHFGPNFAALGEALEATGDTSGASRAWRRARLAAQAAVENGEPDAEEWLEEARAALRRVVR